MLAGSWRFGATTTTTLDRTHRSEIKHPQKRAGRLRNLRAPRPAPLPNPTTKIMKTRPADSRYERGSLGGEVNYSVFSGSLKSHRPSCFVCLSIQEICEIRKHDNSSRLPGVILQAHDRDLNLALLHLLQETGLRQIEMLFCDCLHINVRPTVIGDHEHHCGVHCWLSLFLVAALSARAKKEGSFSSTPKF